MTEPREPVRLVSVEYSPAQRAALDAYWTAVTHDEEHRAVQVMIALGMDTGVVVSCRDPQCVALRQAIVTAELRILLDVLPLPHSDDIPAVTRDIARSET